MSKNKFLNELFSFDPSTHYNYNLSETQISNNEQEHKITQKVSKYLQENLTYLTVKYNALINSDIVIRKFTLNGKGKQYNAALVYIDGMVNSDIVNHYVLNPLMHKNQTNTEKTSETLIINKNTDLNFHTTQTPELQNIIYNSLISQNSIKAESKFSSIIPAINSGFTCVLVDTLDQAFCVEAKGYETRSISNQKTKL